MNAPAPRDSAAFEVREALAQPGCAVCHLAVRSVGRLIQSVAYEQVNDPGLRKQLRAARGFCNEHAYRWLREARSVLGTALIYRDVLHAAIDAVEAGQGKNGQRNGLLRGLLGSASVSNGREGLCPACRVQSEAEARYLEALIASVVADTEAAAALERSDGLCYRHTLAALRVGGPAAELIVDGLRQKIDELLQDLDEVIRKEDYRFRDEPRTNGERTAPSRAIAWAAGAEGLVDL
jgi:hypothetical protein